VCAYVVGSISSERVRPVVEAAMVRFEEHRQLRAELSEARNQLAGRKLVERAKGIVMQSRGLSEDEAYRWLRKQAMARNLKLPDLAQQVVDAANLLL